MCNIYNISVPISSDQSTEFIIVGVNPITLPLIVIRNRSCLTFVMSVTFRVAIFETSRP